MMDDHRARARGFPAPPDRHARLNAFAVGAGLTRGQLLEAGLAAQAEYERRVVSRRPAGGSWALFYQRGFHKHAARDRRWTMGHFGQFLEQGAQ